MLEFAKSLLPQPLRIAIGTSLRLRKRKPVEYRNLKQEVAFSSLATVLGCYNDFAERPPGYTEFTLKRTGEKIRLRNATSDFEVFRQVFTQQQYAIPNLGDLHYIIDAGANIGLTSVFLLARYPNAQIITIEPDPENYEIAAYNLKPFGDRCHLVNAGLWSEDGTLAISRGTFRDGRHWATQTVPVEQSSSESVPSFALQTLLDRFNFPRIDFLKMDIEGAERQVFGEGDIGFLEHTQSCAVECHGPECVAAYEAAVARFGFSTEESGELSISTRSLTEPRLTESPTT